MLKTKHSILKKVISVCLIATCGMWFCGFKEISLGGKVRPDGFDLSLFCSGLDLPCVSVSACFIPEAKKHAGVIFIQDAHGNLEVQNNIISFLKYLDDERLLKSILSEGSEGEVDLSLYSSFPIKSIRDESAYNLLQKGRLSASEYYSIMEGDVSLIGIDDETQYLEHAKLCSDIVTDQSLLDALASELNKKIGFYIRERLSSAAADFLTKGSEFKQNDNQPLDYYRFLLSMLRKVNVDIDHYRHFKSLERIEVLQRKIDTNQLHIEAGKLLDKLLCDERLGEDDIELLAGSQLEMDTGRKSAYQFCCDLKGVALKYGIDFREYKNLNLYYAYMRVFEEVKGRGFDSERKKVEQVLEKKLFEDRKSRECLRFFRSVSFLIDFLSLKLSPEMLKDMANIPTYNDLRESFGFVESCDEGFYSDAVRKIRLFYTFAVNRDQVLAKNILEQQLSKDSLPSVVTAGGFHTSGVTSYLKKKNIPYMVVTPSVSQDRDQLYRRIMSEAANAFGVRQGARGGTVSMVSNVAKYDRSLISEDGRLNLRKDFLSDLVLALEKNPQKDKLLRLWNAKANSDLIFAGDDRLVRFVEVDRLVNALHTGDNDEFLKSVEIECANIAYMMKRKDDYTGPKIMSRNHPKFQEWNFSGLKHRAKTEVKEADILVASGRYREAMQIYDELTSPGSEARDYLYIWQRYLHCMLEARDFEHLDRVYNDGEALLNKMALNGYEPNLYEFGLRMHGLFYNAAYKCYRIKADFDKAWHILKKNIFIAKKQRPQELVSNILSLVTLMIERLDYEKADEVLTEALGLYPDDGFLHRKKAQFLLKLGRLEEAAEHIQRSIEIAPSVAYRHYVKACIYKSMGTDDKLSRANRARFFGIALGSINRSLQLDPSKIRDHRFKVELMMRMKKTDELEVALHELEELFFEDKEDEVFSLKLEVYTYLCKYEKLRVLLDSMEDCELIDNDFAGADTICSALVLCGDYKRAEQIRNLYKKVNGLEVPSYTKKVLRKRMKNHIFMQESRGLFSFFLSDGSKRKKDVLSFQQKLAEYSRCASVFHLWEKAKMREIADSVPDFFKVWIKRCFEEKDYQLCIELMESYLADIEYINKVSDLFRSDRNNISVVSQFSTSKKKNVISGLIAASHKRRQSEAAYSPASLKAFVAYLNNLADLVIKTAPEQALSLLKYSLICEQFYEKRMNSVETLVRITRCYRQMDFTDKAYEYLNEAKRRNPNNMEIDYLEVLLIEDLEGISKAHKAAELLSERYPESRKCGELRERLERERRHLRVVDILKKRLEVWQTEMRGLPAGKIDKFCEYLCVNEFGWKVLDLFEAAIEKPFPGFGKGLKLVIRALKADEFDFALRLLYIDSLSFDDYRSSLFNNDFNVGIDCGYRALPQRKEVNSLMRKIAALRLEKDFTGVCDLIKSASKTNVRLLNAYEILSAYFDAAIEVNDNSLVERLMVKGMAVFDEASRLSFFPEKGEDMALSYYNFLKKTRQYCLNKNDRSSALFIGKLMMLLSADLCRTEFSEAVTFISYMFDLQGKKEASYNVLFSGLDEKAGDEHMVSFMIGKYSQDKKIEEAQNFLRRIYGKSDYPAEVLRRVFEMHVLHGEYLGRYGEDGASFFRRAFELIRGKGVADFGDLSFVFWKARLLLNMEKYEDVIEICSENKKYFEGHNEFAWVYGEALYMQGQLLEAEDILSSALSASDESAPKVKLVGALCDVLLMMGERKDALEKAGFFSAKASELQQGDYQELLRNVKEGRTSVFEVLPEELLEAVGFSLSSDMEEKAGGDEMPVTDKAAYSSEVEEKETESRESFLWDDSDIQLTALLLVDEARAAVKKKDYDAALSLFEKALSQEDDFFYSAVMLDVWSEYINVIIELDDNVLLNEKLDSVKSVFSDLEAVGFYPLGKDDCVLNYQAILESSLLFFKEREDYESAKNAAWELMSFSGSEKHMFDYITAGCRSGFLDEIHAYLDSEEAKYFNEGVRTEARGIYLLAVDKPVDAFLLCLSVGQENERLSDLMQEALDRILTDDDVVASPQKRARVSGFLLDRAVLYLNDGDFTEAWRYYNKAKSIPDDNESPVFADDIFRMYCLLAQGEYLKVKGVLDDLASGEAAYDDVFLMRAYCEFKEGHFLETVHSLNKISPDGGQSFMKGDLFTKKVEHLFAELARTMGLYSEDLDAFTVEQWQVFFSSLSLPDSLGFSSLIAAIFREIDYALLSASERGALLREICLIVLEHSGESTAIFPHDYKPKGVYSEKSQKIARAILMGKVDAWLMEGLAVYVNENIVIESDSDLVTFFKDPFVSDIIEGSYLVDYAVRPERKELFPYLQKMAGYKAYVNNTFMRYYLEEFSGDLSVSFIGKGISEIEENEHVVLLISSADISKIETGEIFKGVEQIRCVLVEAAPDDDNASDFLMKWADKNGKSMDYYCRPTFDSSGNVRALCVVLGGNNNIGVEAMKERVGFYLEAGMEDLALYWIDYWLERSQAIEDRYGFFLHKARLLRKKGDMVSLEKMYSQFRAEIEGTPYAPESLPGIDVEVAELLLMKGEYKKAADLALKVLFPPDFSKYLPSLAHKTRAMVEASWAICSVVLINPLNAEETFFYGDKFSFAAGSFKKEMKDSIEESFIDMHDIMERANIRKVYLDMFNNADYSGMLKSIDEKIFNERCNLDLNLISLEACYRTEKTEKADQIIKRIQNWDDIDLEYKSVVSLFDGLINAQKGRPDKVVEIYKEFAAGNIRLSAVHEYYLKREFLKILISSNAKNDLKEKFLGDFEKRVNTKDFVSTVAGLCRSDILSLVKIDIGLAKIAMHRQRGDYKTAFSEYRSLVRIIPVADLAYHMKAMFDMVVESGTVSGRRQLVFRDLVLLENDINNILTKQKKKSPELQALVRKISTFSKMISGDVFDAFYAEFKKVELLSRFGKKKKDKHRSRKKDSNAKMLKKIDELLRFLEKAYLLIPFEDLYRIDMLLCDFRSDVGAGSEDVSDEAGVRELMVMVDALDANIKERINKSIKDLDFRKIEKSIFEAWVRKRDKRVRDKGVDELLRLSRKEKRVFDVAGNVLERNVPGDVSVIDSSSAVLIVEDVFLLENAEAFLNGGLRIADVFTDVCVYHEDELSPEEDELIKYIIDSSFSGGVDNLELFQYSGSSPEPVTGVPDSLKVSDYTVFVQYKKDTEYCRFLEGRYAGIRGNKVRFVFGEEPFSLMFAAGLIRSVKSYLNVNSYSSKAVLTDEGFRKLAYPLVAAGGQSGFDAIKALMSVSEKPIDAGIYKGFLADKAAREKYERIKQFA